MSWLDAQTLTLYRADAVPASRRGDRMVMVLACILIAVGIGMIYSGSAVMAQKRFGDSAYFLKRQLLWLAVGMVFLLVFARTDLKTLRSWGVPFLLIGLVALVAVLLPMIGVTVKGARRWLRFGVWTIQPAELVKIAVLLYLAHYMAKNGERIEDFRGFMRPLLMVGLVLGLIVARGFRFFAEGFLAVKYGNQGTQFLLTHKLEVAGIALAVVLALYLASRLAFSTPQTSG